MNKYTYLHLILERTTVALLKVGPPKKEKDTSTVQHVGRLQWLTFLQCVDFFLRGWYKTLLLDFSVFDAQTTWSTSLTTLPSFTLPWQFLVQSWRISRLWQTHALRWPPEHQHHTRATVHLIPGSPYPERTRQLRSEKAIGRRTRSAPPAAQTPPLLRQTGRSSGLGAAAPDSVSLCDSLMSTEADADSAAGSAPAATERESDAGPADYTTDRLSTAGGLHTPPPK